MAGQLQTPEANYGVEGFRNGRWRLKGATAWVGHRDRYAHNRHGFMAWGLGENRVVDIGEPARPAA